MIGDDDRGGAGAARAEGEVGREGMRRIDEIEDLIVGSRELDKRAAAVQGERELLADVDIRGGYRAFSGLVRRDGAAHG